MFRVFAIILLGAISVYGIATRRYNDKIRQIESCKSLSCAEEACDNKATLVYSRGSTRVYRTHLKNFLELSNVYIFIKNNYVDKVYADSPTGEKRFLELFDQGDSLPPDGQ
jgi:hypothetical protein